MYPRLNASHKGTSESSGSRENSGLGQIRTAVECFRLAYLNIDGVARARDINVDGDGNIDVEDTVDDVTRHSLKRNGLDVLFTGGFVEAVNRQRETLLKLLTASAFLVFFQTYLFAPLLPSLATEFSSSLKTVGWLIPAFMLPYGFSALIYGTLADRFGRKQVILTLLGLIVITTAVSGFVSSIDGLMLWRALGGVMAGGIIPISVAIMSDIYSYKERGRPLGWLFSGMAGGATFGSTLGAYLNPIIGWRDELEVTAVLTAIVFIATLRIKSAIPAHQNPEAKLSLAFSSYLSLLKTARGSRAYFFIFFNSAFHSGVFSWLGLYFIRRYSLGDQGVGLALLGYGIPGMLCGPMIGRWADRVGRGKLIPLGLAVGAVSTLLLAPALPLLWSTLFVGALSLGYDLTQPLFAGLVTSIDSTRRAQAISLSAFFLFVGFGIGPLAFQWLINADFTQALVCFGGIELLLGFAAIRIFGGESALHAATQN